MKRLITLAIMAVCMVISCNKFDDSAIWDKLNDHENRIAYLEEVCKKINTDIVNLQTIVTALETNDYIVNASPLTTGDGYTFIFKSGKSIVVYNGKDGKDGTNGKDGKDGIDGKDGKDGIDGVIPTISVMKDVDGIYYWTVNNEWLLVNGQKVKASATDGKDGENGTNGVNGADGVTPKFKIEEDFWYISYDNGNTWEKLGKATGNNGLDGINGEDGDSIFQKVTQDDECVYFYLTDGAMITLSKHNTDVIQFEDLNVKAICCKNWDTNYDGELSYEEAAAVKEISGFSGNTTIVAFNELKHFVGLTDITSSAFSSCTSLWKITLPETIEEIGESAFSSCRSLSIYNIPSTVTIIGSRAFAGCSQITEVVIPNGVTAIQLNTFSSCGKLSKVILPNTVESIDSYAFGTNSLKQIIIPPSVNSLSRHAFYYSIMDVYFTSANPPTSCGVENISMGNTRLFVPNEYVDAYKKAWKSDSDACSRIVGYNLD